MCVMYKGTPWKGANWPSCLKMVKQILLYYIKTLNFQIEKIIDYRN